MVPTSHLDGPLDLNNQPLAVGDKVILGGVITAITPRTVQHGVGPLTEYFHLEITLEHDAISQVDVDKISVGASQVEGAMRTWVSRSTRADQAVGSGQVGGQTVNPGDPANSGYSSNPSQSRTGRYSGQSPAGQGANPSQPSTSGYPSPGQSTTGGYPGQSSTGGYSANPSNPSNSEFPSNPGYPANPANPAYPLSGAQTAHPAQPPAGVYPAHPAQNAPFTHLGDSPSDVQAAINKANTNLPANTASSVVQQQENVIAARDLGGVGIETGSVSSVARQKENATSNPDNPGNSGNTAARVAADKSAADKAAADKAALQPTSYPPPAPFQP